jgi:uncharacterized protein (DUF427 family)
MSLTKPPGPLAGSPPETTNYTIDGPAHRLLLHPFPRRVRARFARETVLDTTRGALLHETALLPVLYVPVADVAAGVLEPTDHRTHCPFKGDARYWSVRVGDRVAENAVWSYPEPLPAVPWLAGLVAFYWHRMDAWFDEDEEVFGHLRNPLARVDVRPTSRHVTVAVDGEVVAESHRPLVLSENGLPNRWYLPPADVALDRLVSSTTRTVCPYKGTASYWSLAGDAGAGRAGRAGRADVAWSYEDPSPEVGRIAGHLSFLGEGVTVEVDGHPL